MKLAVIVLDALGPNAVRQLEMENLLQLYGKNGDVFTCSGVPHTAPSNSLLFSGREEHRFWVKFLEKKRLTRRLDPAVFFDRDEGKVKTEDVRLWTRRDYDAPFTWELADAQGLEAVAYDVPLVLPPLRFNADDAPDTDSWFPDSMERCERHLREAVNYTLKRLGESPDLFVTSIQVPDKWFHGLGGDFPDAPGALQEGGAHPVAANFVETEAAWLDSRIPTIVETCGEAGIDWVIMGDHGPPKPGALPIDDVDGSPFVLPKHHKHSIIISSLPNPPTYTADFFPWTLDALDLDPEGEWTLQPGTEEHGERAEKRVVKRLGNLGYL